MVTEAASILRPQDLDLTDKRLLTAVQKGLPLVKRPYAGFGESLGLSEEECIRRIQRLKEGHMIRQISAIFDTRRLGYQSSLVAVRLSLQAGVTGFIFGRNVWQRPWGEALKVTEEIRSEILKAVEPRPKALASR